MIAEIGIVICIYVITRAISFLTRKKDRAEHRAVKGFSILTIVVAGLVLTDLILRGFSAD